MLARESEHQFLLLSHMDSFDTSRPEDKHPLVGTTIGQYRVLDVIATGGMGLVLKACQLMTERTVALKLLPPELVADELNVKRLQREARALAQLNHPNIITTFDFSFAPDGQPFLVIELIEGETIRQLLNREILLPVDRAVPIFRQAADAMRFAHGKGILHRDIKPQNIMICNEPEIDHVKVLDFGIAQLGEDLQRLTRAGEVIGSPTYMSPEQCLGEPVGERSDIYSLGVVMFEVLTGEPPYRGTSITDTMSKKVKEPLPRFNDIVSGRVFPELLESVVLCCLARNPESRLSSMADLKEQLLIVERMYKQSGTVRGARDSRRSSSGPLRLRGERPDGKKSKTINGVGFLAAVDKGLKILSSRRRRQSSQVNQLLDELSASYSVLKKDELEADVEEVTSFLDEVSQAIQKLDKRQLSDDLGAVSQFLKEMRSGIGELKDYEILNKSRTIHEVSSFLDIIESGQTSDEVAGAQARNEAVSAPAVEGNAQIDGAAALEKAQLEGRSPGGGPPAVGATPLLATGSILASKINRRKTSQMFTEFDDISEQIAMLKSESGSNSTRASESVKPLGIRTSEAGASHHLLSGLDDSGKILADHEMQKAISPPSESPQPNPLAQSQPPGEPVSGETVVGSSSAAPVVEPASAVEPVATAPGTEPVSVAPVAEPPSAAPGVDPVSIAQFAPDPQVEAPRSFSKMSEPVTETSVPPGHSSVGAIAPPPPAVAGAPPPPPPPGNRRPDQSAAKMKALPPPPLPTAHKRSGAYESVHVFSDEEKAAIARSYAKPPPPPGKADPAAKRNFAPPPLPPGHKRPDAPASDTASGGQSSDTGRSAPPPPPPGKRRADGVKPVASPPPPVRIPPSGPPTIRPGLREPMIVRDDATDSASVASRVQSSSSPPSAQPASFLPLSSDVFSTQPAFKTAPEDVSKEWETDADKDLLSMRDSLSGEHESEGELRTKSFVSGNALFAPAPVSRDRRADDEGGELDDDSQYGDSESDRGDEVGRPEAEPDYELGSISDDEMKRARDEYQKHLQETTASLFDVLEDDFEDFDVGSIDPSLSAEVEAVTGDTQTFDISAELGMIADLDREMEQLEKEEFSAFGERPVSPPELFAPTETEVLDFLDEIDHGIEHISKRQPPVFLPGVAQQFSPSLPPQLMLSPQPPLFNVEGNPGQFAPGDPEFLKELDQGIGQLENRRKLEDGLMEWEQPKPVEDQLGPWKGMEEAPKAPWHNRPKTKVWDEITRPKEPPPPPPIREAVEEDDEFDDKPEPFHFSSWFVGNKKLVLIALVLVAIAVGSTIVAISVVSSEGDVPHQGTAPPSEPAATPSGATAPQEAGSGAPPSGSPAAVPATGQPPAAVKRRTPDSIVSERSSPKKSPRKRVKRNRANYDMSTVTGAQPGQPPRRRAYQTTHYAEQNYDESDAGGNLP